MIYIKEKFLPVFINGEETKYDISNKGRCKNIKTGKFLKPHKINRRNKILEPLDPENCYYEYALYHNKKYYYKQIGRLVAEHFVPIPQKYLKSGLNKNDLEVDHIDNYRPNNKVKNLQWLTKKENYEKMIKSGHYRIPQGHQSANCKLSESQLDMVGKLLEDNTLTQREISNITNVPLNTIFEIRNGRRFRYLSEKYDFSNFNKFEKRVIDEDIILEIIHMLDEGELPMTKIAKLNNVSVSLVKDIFHKRVHKDLSKQYDFAKRKQKYKC